MDDSKSSSRLSHRMGRFAGAVLRRYLSIERAVRSWLLGKGINSTLCTWFFRILKVALAGLALYVSFLIAVSLIGLWVLLITAEAMLTDDSPTKDDDEDGWRAGHSGVGYYCGNYRIDGARHDADDE